MPTPRCRFGWWKGRPQDMRWKPRSDADQLLRQAEGGNTLIPMAVLCRSFPSEEAPALLAYAESKSFVAFLRAKFGWAAIREALGDYAAGADCGSGFIKPTGKPIDMLEKSWRAGLTEKRDAVLTTWTLVLGAFALLAMVLAAGWILRRRRRLHQRKETLE